MKLLKHIIRAGALCGLLLTTAAAKAQTVQLKVLDWNVLSFEMTDKSNQIDFIVDEYVDLIKAQNPDIVCINELETGTSRMGKEKLTELASRLDMYPYFIMSYPKDVGFYGNGILSKYPIKTRLNLKGTLIVARDIAHARIKQMIDEGKPMPEYFKKHPVYYAGPAKTPDGMASGSFGPTTAGRMDPYVDLFQSLGGSLVMVAKGNRTQQVTDACKKYGGFYLGSIGGPAAILAKNSIKSVEVVDFPELGMEAVRKIYVEDFPAFIIVDDKGNDFFADFKH